MISKNKQEFLDQVSEINWLYDLITYFSFSQKLTNAIYKTITVKREWEGYDLRWTLLKDDKVISTQTVNHDTLAWREWLKKLPDDLRALYDIENPYIYNRSGYLYETFGPEWSFTNASDHFLAKYFDENVNKIKKIIIKEGA